MNEKKLKETTYLYCFVKMSSECLSCDGIHTWKRWIALLMKHIQTIYRQRWNEVLINSSFLPMASDGSYEMTPARSTSHSSALDHAEGASQASADSRLMQFPRERTERWKWVRNHYSWWTSITKHWQIMFYGFYGFYLVSLSVFVINNLN